MPDEPTLGEVVRRFDERFADVRDDIQQLGRRMDEKVDQKLYDLRHEAITQRVSTSGKLISDMTSSLRKVRWRGCQ